jgi:hypothetical protein
MSEGNLMFLEFRRELNQEFTIPYLQDPIHIISLKLDGNTPKIMKAIHLPLALSVLWVPAALADTEAPLITAAAISPTSVDISGGVATVTATLTITDNDSGFVSGNLFLYNPSNNYVNNVFFTQTSRTTGDNYEVTVAVPEFGAPGNWRLDGLVTDAANNTRYYNPQPEGTPFPVPGAMVISVTNTGTVDSNPPELVSASVSPGELEVSSSQVVATFTIECSDSPSGFNYGFIYPRNPSGVTEGNLITFFNDLNMVAPGVFEVEITVPRGSQSGEWSFEVFLNDQVGNSAFHQGGNFTVSSLPPGPGSDSTFLSHAVDAVHLPFTTSGTGWFIGENDTNDGIDSAWPRPVPDGGFSAMSTTITGPGTLRFFWRVSSEENDDFLAVDIPSATIHHEISGDTTWEEMVLSIPPGTHGVTWSYTKGESGTGNQDMAWVDQVRFAAQSADTELPRLQALRISPGRIDVANPEDVIITMEITDDFHGCENGKVELINPSGNIEDTRFFDFNDRVEGDDMAGLYEVTFPITGTAEHGIWRINVELEEDFTSSVRTYGPGSEPFPLTDTEKFYVGVEDPPDTQPPVLGRLEVYPQSADVSSGDAPVIVTLHATDLPAGLDNGYVSIRNPDDGWTGSYFLSRLTGNQFNGIYQAEAVVPVFGTTGTWSVSVNLWDFEPNDVEYPYGTPFPPAIDPEFTVVNHGAEDTEMPFVSSIAINPSSIDTTSSPANIQVTVTLGDALSGILESFAYVFDPSNQFRGEFFTVLNGSNRTSGDFMNGTYQFVKTLPVGSMPGDWRIEIFVRDKTGRIRIVGTNSDPYPAGSGVFTVAAAGGNWFESKMAVATLTGNDALLGADPDHDGKTNAEEAASNGNPAVPDGPAFATLQRTPTHLYLVFELDPSLTVGTSGDYLTLGDGSLQPLRLTGEIQDGLTGAWTRVLPEPVPPNTWRIGIPLAGGASGFVRLRFENP